jgi:hypothetical protein
MIERTIWRRLARRGLSGTVSAAIVLAPLGILGCQDNTPPPPRVFVPSSGEHDSSSVRSSDPIRPNPAPPPRPVDRGAPFHDEPLVEQAPPEQPAFVAMYRKVDSPRILLFVNRTMQGDILPVNTDQPSVTVTHTRTSNGPVDVESSSSVSGSAHAYGYGWYDSYGNYHASASDKFSSKGAARYSESTDVYLHPGDYDEVQAKSLDYEAIENIMTDWIACQGQVRPQMLSEVAQQLNADILIQVQAHPTRQTEHGLEVRLIAEAINTHGGQSLARATVDMDPPLDKPQINRYTRFLARKLMSDMTATWSAPPPPEMRSADQQSTPAAPAPLAPAQVAPAPAAPTPVAPAPSSPPPAESSHTMPPLFGAPVTPAPAPTTSPSATPGVNSGTMPSQLP